MIYYKQMALVFWLSVSLTAFSQNIFPVKEILHNGLPNERINLVFLPDGFTESQLDSFELHAQAISTFLFSESPLKEYKNFFNTYLIRVPSQVSGVAPHPDSLINNYFGSTFGYADVERLLVPMKEDAIVDVLWDNFKAADQVIIVANSPLYGGSGDRVFMATTSTHVNSKRVAYHELGHSFADLQDEYFPVTGMGQEKANMTQNGDSTTIRWKKWLGVNGVGIYPYPDHPEWFRPHQSCKMSDNKAPYCSVCRAQYIESIYALLTPLLDFSSSDTVFDSVSSPSITFSLNLIHPNPNTLKVVWKLNEEIIALQTDTLTLHYTQVQNNSVLEAFIVDTTDMLRNSTVLNYARWQIVNQVVGIKEVPQTYTLRISPNPASDYLDIQLQQPAVMPYSIKVFGVDGRLVDAFQSTSATYRYDIHWLPIGMYQLQIQSGSVTMKQSFLVVR